VFEMMEEDTLRWGLIQAGHTAIFSWVALYVASGIALLQIIIQVLKIYTFFSFALMVFGIIYLVLACLMTLSVYSISKIMHRQNYWASQFGNPKLRLIFFESRSNMSQLIVGEKAVPSVLEKVGVALHFFVIIAFGVSIVCMNVFLHWLPVLWGA
jgi:hypothetical protein